jgi:hypothetical protein
MAAAMPRLSALHSYIVQYHLMHDKRRFRAGELNAARETVMGLIALLARRFSKSSTSTSTSTQCCYHNNAAYLCG